MFRKSWLPTLTRLQISELRGGEKHNFCYSVGISEGAESDFLIDTMHAKLLNQRGSQRPPMFPEGYEPFEVTCGTEVLWRAKLCLRTMTISVPRLMLVAVGWPNRTLAPRVVPERKSACIMNPTGGTEAFHALGAEARTFEIKHRIRHRAAESRAKLDLVLSLMEYSAARPLCDDPADRFEAYLYLRPPESLRDLLALLDMPDSLAKPAGPDFVAGGVDATPKNDGQSAGHLCVPTLGHTRPQLGNPDNSPASI
jgi:hypothetical protein